MTADAVALLLALASAAAVLLLLASASVSRDGTSTLSITWITVGQPACRVVGWVAGRCVEGGWAVAVQVVQEGTAGEIASCARNHCQLLGSKSNG